jgi:phosphopantothenate---cysteine ligase (CTP)
MEKGEYDCPEVVITAGGTREKIDDVRYIGNFSGGRLGHALAESYARMGSRVLLLTPSEVPDRFGLPQGVEHQPFTSADSLDRAMKAVPAARMVLHAAAVSDYTPVCTEGKISSDQDELVVRLSRTPKILPKLRDYFGDCTTIIGFKLLSGVSEDDLVETATKQITDNQTNFCIANDLQEIGRQSRRLHVVRSDGTYDTLSGSTREVAEQIVLSLPLVTGDNYVRV